MLASKLGERVKKSPHGEVWAESISKGGIEETGAMMPYGNIFVHFFFLITDIDVAHMARNIILTAT
jgi:hypothetical protein